MAGIRNILVLSCAGKERLGLGDYSVHPGRDGVQHFGSDFRIVAAAARRYMEGMIGLGKKFEGGQWAEALDERLEQVQLGKFIFVALEE